MGKGTTQIKEHKVPTSRLRKKEGKKGGKGKGGKKRKKKRGKKKRARKEKKREEKVGSGVWSGQGGAAVAAKART